MITSSKDLECKSSAVTLSDMEIFIFPELLYSLVLANIMSPRIWRWLDDPWFAGIDKLTPYRRITRLKQYIMDHYVFNLDLDTWGLTTKEREISRFKDFIDMDTLKKSNALFGYEGDKYYFDIDIRTHFGLDKYEGNVIPYWKTETVEAMDAFKHKPNYGTGAGECVSLAALYASALFIVAGVPLKDIYLMATPLHSQNFVDLGDGILTNNRRLVTKNMWFNGTELSAQARRALENEQVTVVTHETGYIHTVYEKATISLAHYANFSNKLSRFLKVKFNNNLFGNFLRDARYLQKCFQIKWPIHGVDHYVPAERVFAYEHGSPYQFTGNTREKLMAEIELEEFSSSPLPERILLNTIENFVSENKIDLDKEADVERLKNQFEAGCLHRDAVIAGLSKFCHVKPRLPDVYKQFVPEQGELAIDRSMTREQIIARLEEIRVRNTVADMAFYAYRDLNRTETEPFIMAAVCRNPVCIDGARNLDTKALLEKISNMPDESIYDESGRLAQPDEVWNYGRGDGFEKAILLANILRSRLPKSEIHLDITPDKIVLACDSSHYEFRSTKGLNPASWPVPL
ncbi:MAG: hypothetical protein PHR77_01860 [Kiritimatiellae bacterium]|nr:hypothetical protein [Kiritimatiellia bacterium]